MNKALKIISLLVILFVVGFLIYAFSPLLYDREVNEEFPIPLETSIPKVVEDVAEQETTLEPAENTTSQEAIEQEEVVQEPQALYSGVFQNGERSYEVEGTAQVFELDDGSQVLRLENFKSTNGPNLKIYLGTDTTAQDIVSLGDLKGNVGDQNYILPEGVDLDKYDTVLIWCEQFSRHFGNAVLS